MKFSISFIKESTSELVNYNHEQLVSLFLDWFNNFLTIDAFAEYYNLSRYEASRLIDKGREAHEHNL